MDFMDINDMRSIVTVLAFGTFIGIVLWAYNGKSKPGFEEAARLPFADDGVDTRTRASLDSDSI
jgi:cytochrome c oxidase cbb3-type subunit 4